MEKTIRLPLQKKEAARYTKGEEIFNTLTHAAGAAFGVFVLVFGILRAVLSGANVGVIAAAAVYGACMIVTYVVSAVYHALKPNTGKRVLRVIDHCAIYLLIMGTYTGIVVAGILPVSPAAALAILLIQWIAGALAITLTAVNMKKFVVFSMLCYILLGWCIIAIPHIVLAGIGLKGFLWLLFGGIAYTAGSVLYVIGRKKRYVHGVFHLFCLLGSVLQFICFAVYCF
ncbi:MAG: hemolysin III family protein [Firmicutes bacterium]|nr:hemolysin III family protein [Bacillota bacterium]